MADWSIPVRVVSENRDAADWFLYSITLLAAIAAVIGLWGWVAEQRKRPELRFRWFQPNGQTWGLQDCPTFAIGTEYSISFALDNTGNGTAERAVVNVMVPEFAQAFFPTGRGFPGVPITDGLGVVSGDATVGLPPRFTMTFLQPPSTPITPGLTSMYEFRLKVLRDPGVQASYHLAVSVEDPRLNARGRRKLPILAVPIDRYPDVPDPWPGKPIRRVLSRAEAQPKESVRVLPGRRVDRRQFRIGPATP
jgi:hypothetical protein